MLNPAQNRKRTWLSLLVLVAACILLNNIGARLNGLLGLPFYIDNIGTILAALLGGYIPCITVGFFSNIFNAIANPDSIYYCVISVFIASLAAMYAPKLRRVKIPYILLAVLTFAFLGGVVGGMLTAMPIDILKLDMSFIRNMLVDKKSLKLIDLIMDIARFLGVPVVAEGVEEERQYLQLKEMGCDIIQGYYFSPPLPADEFDRLIKKSTGSASDT